MAGNLCPHCAAENRPGARHCRQCGQPLPQASPPTIPTPGDGCRSCHAPLSPGARFCPRCGAAVTDTVPAPPLPSSSAAPPPAYAPPSPPFPPPAPETTAKKRSPLLPIILIGGLLLLCLCVVGVVAVTRLWERLPWSAQPISPPIATEMPVITTESPSTPETSTPEMPRLAERWAFRERGGASPGMLLVQPDCPTCDVRAEVFRPAIWTIQLGGDRLYYWDELLEEVYYVTPAGAVIAIPSPEQTVADFAVAPDASLIAWGIFDSDETGVTARVILTDGEGGQARLLTEKRFTMDEGPRNLIPFAWSADRNTVYVAQRYWGIGGYILFDILPDPLAVDATTGAVRSLNASECSLAAISPDGATLAYLVYVEDHHDLILRNLRTGAEQRIAGTPGRYQAGDLHFSPDSRFLAYVEAVGDPAAEAFDVRRVEITTGAIETLIADEQVDYFGIGGWVGNAAGGFDLVIVGQNGSERLGASGRTPLSPHTFVGSWITTP